MTTGLAPALASLERALDLAPASPERDQANPARVAGALEDGVETTTMMVAIVEAVASPARAAAASLVRDLTAALVSPERDLTAAHGVMTAPTTTHGVTTAPTMMTAPGHLEDPLASQARDLTVVPANRVRDHTEDLLAQASQERDHTADGVDGATSVALVSLMPGAPGEDTGRLFLLMTMTTTAALVKAAASPARAAVASPAREAAASLVREAAASPERDLTAAHGVMTTLTTAPTTTHGVTMAPGLLEDPLANQARDHTEDLMAQASQARDHTEDLMAQASQERDHTEDLMDQASQVKDHPVTHGVDGLEMATSSINQALKYLLH